MGVFQQKMCKVLISLATLGMVWCLWRGHNLLFAASAISYISAWAGLLLSEREELAQPIGSSKPSIEEGNYPSREASSGAAIDISDPMNVGRWF